MKRFLFLSMILLCFSACKKEIYTYGIYVYTGTTEAKISYSVEQCNAFENICGFYSNTSIQTQNRYVSVMIERISGQDTIRIFPDNSYVAPIEVNDTVIDIRDIMLYQANQNINCNFDSVYSSYPGIINMFPSETKKEIICHSYDEKY